MKNPKGWRARLALAAMVFFAATALFAEPANLDQAKQEIIAYVESGAYAREMAEAASPALKLIVERAARRTAGERLTLVLDIDETVLSSLPTLRENDFGYVPTVWDAWVAKGEAAVIAPMLAVYEAARAAGVEVVFITGRREKGRAATEKNLRAAGLGAYAGLYFKPDGSKDTSEKFKAETRRRLTAEGCVIIANIGDQESDLAGGFAERTFKLPDPFYLTK